VTSHQGLVLISVKNGDTENEAAQFRSCPLPEETILKLLRFMTPVALMAVVGCASVANRPDASALEQLTPTGKLRFSVAFAPEPSTFFVAKDASGQPSGVAVDLARDLARQLGRPVEFFVAPNSGKLTDALLNGTVDAALMPVDAERRKKLDIGPFILSAKTPTWCAPAPTSRPLTRSTVPACA
jgi:hypothetical protein